MKWLIKQFGGDIVFRVALLAIMIGVVVLVLNTFMNAGATALTNMFAQGSYANLSVNILASMLPANTTALISLTLSMDLTILLFRQAMLFLRLKSNYLKDAMS